jgi:hypothetical protein
MMSGEKPGDTGRLWVEVFLRLFGVLELGVIGRVLNHIGIRGGIRKLVLFVGLLCVFLFVARACHDARPNRLVVERIYGTTNELPYEIKDR